MADMTPRPRDTRPTSSSGGDREPRTEALASEELATRKWMLVLGAGGVFAIIVAAIGVFGAGGGSSSPGLDVRVSSASATAAGAASSAPTAAPTATAAAASNAALSEARANIATLESRIKETDERTAALEQRLQAGEQVLQITTGRAETLEAALKDERAERAEFQTDLDAINAELTEANADRAALRAQVAAAESRAAKSDAAAAGLRADIVALHNCLNVHQQALYYTTLDNWGLLAAPMQDAASSCFEQIG